MRIELERWCLFKKEMGFGIFFFNEEEGKKNLEDER